MRMSKGVLGGGRRGTVKSIAAGTKCKAEKSDCSWGRGWWSLTAIRSRGVVKVTDG